MTQSMIAAGHIAIRIDGKLYCCDSISVDLDANAKVMARIVGLRVKRRAKRERKAGR